MADMRKIYDDLMIINLLHTYQIFVLLMIESLENISWNCRGEKVFKKDFKKALALTPLLRVPSQKPQFVYLDSMLLA